MKGIHVVVSYTQFSVFDPKLPNPFNDWSDEHVAQGFSWRPGSVSFGTLESDGDLFVRVIMSKPFDENSSMAERIIAVPFRVPDHDRVELGSIGGGVEVCIPSGDYELIYEHGRDESGGMWVNLYLFSVSVPVRPKVIRADLELSPPAVFLMKADPA